MHSALDDSAVLKAIAWAAGIGGICKMDKMGKAEQGQSTAIARIGVTLDCLPQEAPT